MVLFLLVHRFIGVRVRWNIHPSFVQPLCSFYSTNQVVLTNLQLHLLMLCQRHCLQTIETCRCNTLTQDFPCQHFQNVSLQHDSLYLSPSISTRLYTTSHFSLWMPILHNLSSKVQKAIHLLDLLTFQTDGQLLSLVSNPRPCFLNAPFHSSNSSCSSCLFSAILAKSSAYTIFLRRSTNPIANLPCISNHFSTSCLNANIPSVVPFPFLNPCCSSPNSCSTLFLILPSRVLSSSFMMWLRNAMPLYYPGLGHLPSSTTLGQLALFTTRLVRYLSSYM